MILFQIIITSYFFTEFTNSYFFTEFTNSYSVPHDNGLFYFPGKNNHSDLFLPLDFFLSFLHSDAYLVLGNNLKRNICTEKFFSEHWH